MRPSRVAIAVVTLGALLAHGPDAGAAWPVAGLVLPGAGSIRSGQMISDGNGGVFVASGRDSAMRLEHIDGNGNRLWTLQGPSTLLDSYLLAMDGAGGFYVAWTGVSSLTSQVYLARYSNVGNEEWRVPLYEGTPGSMDERWLAGLAAGASGDVFVCIADPTDGTSVRITRIQRDGQRPAAWPSDDTIADGRSFGRRAFMEDGMGGVFEMHTASS